jgi:hypothetical protein
MPRFCLRRTVSPICLVFCNGGLEVLNLVRRNAELRQRLRQRVQIAFCDFTSDGLDIRGPARLAVSVWESDISVALARGSGRV